MVKQGPCLQEAHSPVPWAWGCWENRLDTVGGILLEKVVLRCPREKRQVVDPKREEPGVWGLKLQQEKRDWNIRDGQGPRTEDRKGASCNVTQLIWGQGYLPGEGLPDLAHPLSDGSTGSHGFDPAEGFWKAAGGSSAHAKLLNQTLGLLYPPGQFSPTPEFKVLLSTSWQLAMQQSHLWTWGERSPAQAPPLEVTPRSGAGI